jgi:two-component system, LytTR family, response regulator
MNKIKAVLVDDEESARDVLENLLSRFCPDVTVVGKCENIPTAVELIKTVQPDLVFLDIEMPGYAGYEIVNFFDKINFEIIFATAYDQYAIRAFEISAIDYLLKPIDITRLKEAVSKVKHISQLKLTAERLTLVSETIQSKEIKSILVTDKGYQQIISVDTIIAIEAEESYCIIHTNSKKHTVSKNLKHYETIFSDHPNFIRVHKSWMISRNHILNYSKSELTINLANGLSAKLSKYKKAEFEEILTRS